MTIIMNIITSISKINDWDVERVDIQYNNISNQYVGYMWVSVKVITTNGLVKREFKIRVFENGQFERVDD